MEYPCGHILIVLLIFLGSVIVAHCGEPKLSLKTPDVTILQPAVYQCTVTGLGQGQSDSVTLRWRVNGIISTSPDDWDPFISDNGITLTGNSTDNTLTIPKGTTLNETTVECIALGIVNEVVYHTLYIQGKPASVHLTCSLYSVYTIQCNWSIPYTIMGINITGYNINITSNNILVHQSLVTETTEYYNVSHFGVYNISVVAVIGDLEGEIDTMMIDVPEVMIDDWPVVYVGSIQTVNCSIMDTQFYNTKPVMMVITADNDQYTLNIINSYSSIITGELEWSYGRKKLNVSLMVEYDNGLQVYSSGNRTLNTFHVQNVTINSYPDGTVCFECVFIHGINNGGCFINFNCSQTGLGRNITANLIGCLYDIVSNYYHIYVYDLESDRTIAEQPAYTTSRMIKYSPSTGHNDKSTAIVIGVVAMIAMIVLSDVISPDIILC